jgi:hypothetical protein
MSIYQSQYIFMKQHFYQQETDANQEVEIKEAPKNKAKSIDKKKKRRR